MHRYEQAGAGIIRIHAHRGSYSGIWTANLDCEFPQSDSNNTSEHTARIGFKISLFHMYCSVRLQILWSVGPQLP